MRNAYLFLALFFSQQAVAESASSLLKKYELLAKQENAAFVGFAADKGERFFHAERLHSDGKKSVVPHAIPPTHVSQEKPAPIR